MKLTQEILKRKIKYDPDTGQFWRIMKDVSRNIDYLKPIAHFGPRGYLKFNVMCKEYSAARLAFLYMTGRLPDAFIDHINRQPSDNRWCNLREADRCQNGYNREKMSTNTTGYKGVSFDKAHGKFKATIQANRKSYQLGYYSTPEEAWAVYKKAATRLHGEYRCVNEIS